MEAMENKSPVKDVTHDIEMPERTTDTRNGTAEITETTSLINNAENNTNENEENSEAFEDHPLRALSSLSIDGTGSFCDSAISCSSHLNDPEVYIHVPNKSAGYHSGKSRKKKCESGCIPLKSVFHSDDVAHSDPNRPGEHSPFDYKNWLVHLGRRRRCEIMILIGFFLWLAFFVVLAIVLNGNSSKVSDDVDDGLLRHGSNAGSIFSGKSNFSSDQNESIPTNTKPRILDSTVTDHDKTTKSKPEPSILEPGLTYYDNTGTHTKPIIIDPSIKDKPDINHDDAAEKEIKNKQNPSKNTDEKNKSEYLIGVSRSDITGPAADITMMGYANQDQTSGGIHMRQFARAFIIIDHKTNVRTAYVNIDACMATTLMKLEVLKALQLEFGNLYTAENLCIAGTHTHSAPAGYLQDVLFQISSWGYVDETLVALVEGIVKSIRIAHNSIQPGYILMNKGQLVGSNINRSPTAYLNNPSGERNKYKHNVDTEMILLKFMNEKDEGIGMINWFPVHCTSMNNTNRLISGDNKGLAELRFEKYMDPDSLPGSSKFVAAFAQSNEGDVSPNTKGPRCLDTGESCDNMHSTCNGNNMLCVAFGPGKDMFESTKIIANNQYEKAKTLYENAATVIKGPVKFIHQYIDMTKYEVIINNTIKVKTCKPAMGYSFAAGTTDGPGVLSFKQGVKTGNTFWSTVRNFLTSPSEEQINCHLPKPILVDTGEMTSPYEWQPEIVDSQIFQIGQFFILALPGEFTTMAGRRLRGDVLNTLKKHNPRIQYEVVLAGLANAYSDYITTFEEYQVQRYEGASTIYGPYTAKAYAQQFVKLANLLMNNKTVKSSVFPTNNKAILYSLQPGVIFDSAPMGYDYGDVLEDVKATYTQGGKVSVKFVAGNPRSCLQMHAGNSTFLIVEREQLDMSWKIVHTDVDWETKFIWERPSNWFGLPSARSDATITWDTNANTLPGRYRIAHYGCYKNYHTYPYSGQSSVFTIKKV